jgi:hypothetical protein
MKLFVLSLTISLISGAVVLHKDPHTVEAHDTLPDGTKIDETIHFDPHHINHTVLEKQDHPGGHREVYFQSNFSSYGTGSARSIKGGFGNLHPRIRALRKEHQAAKKKYLD